MSAPDSSNVTAHAVDEEDIEYPALVAARRKALIAELSRISFPDATFVWELGSGHGHYLNAYAEAHPAKVCIGIDLIADRVARANRKRDRANLTQLHFLHSDARLFLEALPVGVTISDVFILFPDPWPKNRHHKHRILQPEFLSRLRPKLKPDAKLYFRTDHEPYFLRAQETIRMDRAWQLSDSPWPFEHETVFQQRAISYRSLCAEPVA